ncbi:acyl-CoA reductase-like NAD-dependent aldehyde dehydrogenase [Pseudonocardia hierapolitana]|uniref:Acyl-CoA reductase-like NAD-dependent aldehyde dehydrogenase n=1 Tax=Pseudonocardia hierapolitana TaxID=1128676 RepID=A0A561SN36_9PSEU|nr:aldehyde dehydrogenase family protein [Pseudonocardia hierapolitana]TWF76268.1 acyl-CoA reductase-like NAD-dependent aldehyde dehydrogenase [Pseudonocardia hierapolitana]
MTVLENRELTVLDPRTDEVVGRVPIASPERCDEAVSSARRAAAGWARTPAAERGAALHAAAAAVRAAADELAALNARETGKPVDDARGGVDAGIGTLVQYAELGPVHRGRSLHGGWDATDLMVPEPRGVVAVLTPWNDPVAVAAGLIGAALATGNTVVHKPSERCPQTGRRFAELVAAHLPPGVLEIVDGDGAVGARLAEAEVDVVAHVGSTATGRAIAEACARTGARALLENGGNDALVVDADIDPEWAAAQAALGAFANAGQICVSVERIYVHACLADAFLDALVREAEQWRERIGPLVDRAHRGHVHGHVEAALGGGARALTGGAVPDGPGAFYPPTVLIGCVPHMSVMRDETFGPVAPVRVVPDFATALQEAGADRYGLAATVLTSDMAHAQRAWRELPVGTVKVNDVFGGAPGGASQPRGASGSGFGFGPELLDEMTAVKVVHLAPAPGPA